MFRRYRPGIVPFLSHIADLLYYIRSVPQSLLLGTKGCLTRLSINNSALLGCISLLTKLENDVIWDFPEVDKHYTVEPLGNVPKKRIYSAIKRAFDFIVSAIAIVLLLIPMTIIALLIIVDSPGKPIYTQLRLGKNEKPFKLLKFRSMYSDAEETGIRGAEENDERVTKIGKWIRKTRVDELPQLFNILIGQMSIVGPRPERPEFYDLFDMYIDGFRQRMVVIPGLTGLAQVNGGYDLKPEEKIVYDMQYIRERSIKTDMICILQTVGVILGRKGAR